jgi:nucleoside-diphosphate-sugar epimerase
VISRFYDGLRCFVTGGNGLIGGALCEFLLKNNAKSQCLISQRMEH